MPGRPHTGWVLADQQSGSGNAVQQGGVAGRVGNVDSPGQHRHRHTVGGKRGAVGGAVDAVRAAGDDDDLMFGQTG